MTPNRLTVTVLGCGSSGGVPRIGGDWGNCDPDNPRNRRQRCALLVERHTADGTTQVLVDAGPDLRAQCLAAGVSRLDAVLVTHEHADHIHGIDELRGIYLRNKQTPIPLWTSSVTAAVLRQRFGYAFRQIPGSGYRPFLTLQEIRGPLTLAGPGGAIRVESASFPHGGITSLGFRMGPVAYTPDLNALPAEARPLLQDLDTWIVDALQHKPHPTHTHLAQTLAWIEELRPRRAVLTNMHNDLDYDVVAAATPAHVVPAHDGLVLEFAL